MELKTVQVGSWNRFLTRNFSIDPQLVGTQHEFLCGASRICIVLPSSEHINLEPCRGERLRFDYFSEVDGKKMPLQFWVESVDVIVKGEDEVSLPPEVLQKVPNRYELIPVQQQERLNSLVCKFGAIAQTSFDLWIRTLRWKSWNSAIGRPEINGHESGWSTYLVAQPKLENFWIAPIVFEAKDRSKLVTPSIWEAVALALDSGSQPPLFVDLLMDAAEHVKLGEFQRGIVEIAMSCEVFLRTLVAGSLSPDLQPSISEYIDDASIRVVLEKFVPEVLANGRVDDFKAIRSKLHKLFDVRNSIVHKGTAEPLSGVQCDEFIGVATQLVNLYE
jgi:hypothetical protein